jgi:hypothetical protein
MAFRPHPLEDPHEYWLAGDMLAKGSVSNAILQIRIVLTIESSVLKDGTCLAFGQGIE